MKRPCLSTKFSNTQIRSYPGDRNPSRFSDEARQFLRDSIEKDSRAAENLQYHINDYYDELDELGEDYDAEGTMQDTIKQTLDEKNTYIETIHIKVCLLEGSETGRGTYEAWDWIRADLTRENSNGELNALVDHVSEVLQTEYAQVDFETQWANYEHILPFLNIFSQSNVNPQENVEDQTQVSQPSLTADAPDVSGDLDRMYDETQDNHSGVEPVQENTGLAENNTSQNQTSVSESFPVDVSPSNNSSVHETQAAHNVVSEQAAQENVEDQTQVSQPSLTADAPDLGADFNNMFDPNSHGNQSNGNSGSLLDDFADTSCEPGDFTGGDD